MVSRTNVGRPHAVTSRIDETHVSMPQAQSSLMNYPSNEFIQVDKEVEWYSCLRYCRKEFS